MTHEIKTRRTYIEYNKWLSKLFHNLFPDVDGGGGEEGNIKVSGTLAKLQKINLFPPSGLGLSLRQNLN
jgi:hypothetical protein